MTQAGHNAPTLLLSRAEVRELLTLADCIRAVETVFRMLGDGSAAPPAMTGVHAGNGGFHVKAGVLDLSRRYFAAKTNANFPDNPRAGLPVIQGFIALFDADNGCLLALMDSIEITILRTGAATAVAAQRLARADSRSATICGCGNQGRVSLHGLLQCFPLQEVYLHDMQRPAAERLAAEFAALTRTTVVDAPALPAALRDSAICVTCTTSTKYFVRRDDVAAGTFLAAVGADNPHKQELEPALVAASTLVVDSLDQCADSGELHHALDAGLMRRDGVHAELGAIVAGRRAGRTAPDEIIVFDSTGLALQDVAAAALVYERARTSGTGLRIALNST